MISDIKCTYLDVSTIENKALELNRMYFTYYLDPNSLGVLVERLSEVQFGAVLCGMTTEYDGDIRDIFKQNYPEMENLSVAQALGLITEREVEDYAGTYYFPVDSFGDGTYVDFLDIEPVGLDQLHIRRQSYRITIFDVYTDLPENDVITLYDENGMRVDIIYHFHLGAVQIETADTEDSLGISGWYYLNPESVSTETDLNVDYSWIEGKYHQAHYAPMTLELWFDSEAPWEYGNDWYVCYNIHDDYEILRDGLAYYMGGGEKPTFYGGNPYSPGSEIQFDYDGYNFVLTSEDGAFDGTSFFLE